MDELLITENDIDLAHALENTLTIGDLVDPAFGWQDTPVVVEVNGIETIYGYERVIIDLDFDHSPTYEDVLARFADRYDDIDDITAIDYDVFEFNPDDLRWRECGRD